MSFRAIPAKGVFWRKRFLKLMQTSKLPIFCPHTLEIAAQEYPTLSFKPTVSCEYWVKFVNFSRDETNCFETSKSQLPCKHVASA